MRSYKEFLDAFMESDEWHKAADPVSLRAPPRMREYLQNRLKEAFDAGWNAREELDRLAERRARA